ncbi:MAG: hypothetical protein KGK11_05375 [Sphingomonadales bacterium]|nr:hypothetical protein [Sphingomonadales bacterium]
MIDDFAIGLTHLLLLIAAWRLLRRDDLDADPRDETPAPAPPRRGRMRRA